MMQSGGGNNPMMGLMQKAAACGGAKAQQQCSQNQDCEWKADDNGEEKCDLSGAVAIQMMLGGGDNNPMMGLMQKGMACEGAKAQQQCSQNQDCEWKANDNGEEKCDLSGAVAMQIMLGGGDNNPMMGLMQKVAACGGAKAQQQCSQNQDCEWKADDNGEEKCDLSGAVAMQMML